MAPKRRAAAKKAAAPTAAPPSKVTEAPTVPEPELPRPKGLTRLSRIDKGRQRSGFEIPRKIFHSAIGFVVLYLYLSDHNVKGVLDGLSIYGVVLISTELTRFYSPGFERAYEAVMGVLMREEERDRVNGTCYYVLGVFLSFLFFPKDIGCVAVIILSWCDTTASIFGRLFGKYTPRLPLSGVIFGKKKSFAGTIAAFAVGSMIGYFFWGSWGPQGDMGRLSWAPGRSNAYSPEKLFMGVDLRLPNPDSSLSFPAIVIVTGIVAGLSEAIDVYGVDDNLTLPVFSAIFLYIAMYLS